MTDKPKRKTSDCPCCDYGTLFDTLDSGVYQCNVCKIFFDEDKEQLSLLTYGGAINKLSIEIGELYHTTLYNLTPPIIRRAKRFLRHYLSKR